MDIDTSGDWFAVSNFFTLIGKFQENDQDRLVELLIKKPELANAIHRSTGEHVLMFAIRVYRFEVVELLLLSGAILPNNELILIDAISRGCSVTTAEALIKAGANLNVFDRNCNNLLHMASEMRNYRLIDLFIKKGILVDARNIYGMTPLHKVLYTQPFDLDMVYKCLEILIRNGANENAGFPYWDCQLTASDLMKLWLAHGLAPMPNNITLYKAFGIKAY